jgi:putative membrane protein
MKRWTNVLLAVSVAAAASACAGDRATTADGKAVGTSGTVADAKKDPDNKAERTDRDFVGDMMADGRAEVSLGKLAQQKARNQKVKEFAAMMIRDHQRAGTELKTLASQVDIDMSKVDADIDHGKATYERLSTLSGLEFDREYMKSMVEDHKRALKDVEDQADGAENDHIKQWAAKTLPTLKKHLEQAKDISESLEKQSGS